jgi:hypothetical protein
MHHGRQLVKTAKNALRCALIAVPLIVVPGLALSLEWTSASGGSDTWYERIAAHLDWSEAPGTAPASRFNGMGGELVPLFFQPQPDSLSGQVPTVAAIGGSGEWRPIGRYAGARQETDGLRRALAYRSQDDHADVSGFLRIDWDSPCLWKDPGCTGNASRSAVAFDEQEGNPLPEPVALVLIGLAAAAFGLRRRGG